MSSPKRPNHAFGKGPQNSFMEFQSQTEDAWDPGDDEWMTSVVSLKVAQSTAQEVIEKHSEQQRRLKQQPGDHAGGDEESNGSRVKAGPKAAPGVGVRLNASPRGLNSLYRRGTNNDKPQKKEKCQRILAGPITSLDELRSIAWSGIPSDLRAVVWKLLSDFLPPDVERRAAVLEEKRKQYENYLKQYYPMRLLEANSSMFKQIQKDLVRMSILHDKKRMQEAWVFIIFILSRRVRRMPHMYTTMYLFSILLMSAGCLGNEVVQEQYRLRPDQVLQWQAYLPFILFFVGVVGTRVWILIIAIVLVLLKKRGLCFLLFFKWLFFLAGFGSPVLVTGVLLMLAGNRLKDVDLIFQFGRSQLITSVFMLIACMVGMVISMVILVRHDTATSDPDSEGPETSPSAASSIAESSPSPMEPRTPQDAVTVVEDNAHIVDRSDTEELVENYDGGFDEALESWLNARQCTLPQHNSTSEQRQICQRNLINYRKSTRSFLQEAGEAGLGDVDKEYQTHEHTILFILAVISMFLGTMLCIWRLVNESISGVYLMLEFLDIIFSFGQGFFAFALFGLDTDLIILPFKKRWRKLLYGVEEIHLPPEANLDNDIILTRQHFVRFHLQRCKKALVGRKRYRLTVYDNVFRGDHFVAWLQRVGLASNNIDAIAYGQKLLYGRVLYHVKREHHLHNLPYFYQFSTEFDNQEVETEIDEGPLLLIEDSNGPSLNARTRHPQKRK